MGQNRLRLIWASMGEVYGALGERILSHLGHLGPSSAILGHLGSEPEAEAEGVRRNWPEMAQDGTIDSPRSPKISQDRPRWPMMAQDLPRSTNYNHNQP